MSGKSTQRLILGRLLLLQAGRGRLAAALAALFIGNLLLLLSVLIWWNFTVLLSGKGSGESLGSTFLVIAKKVTNDNMGKKNATIFSSADIDAVKAVPQVQEVGVITANHFPVYAMMGGNLAFATDLPLEAVPDSFLDNIPGGWGWKPGDVSLPVIVSTQFLDIYNYVFAPSQGLPQLSQSSIQAIGITLKVGGEGRGETLIAHVAGFSDRINSVMVPQSFIDYGNSRYSPTAVPALPSRLILRTADPSDTRFTDYLGQHNYTTNAQNLRWSKMRSIVTVVTTATGGIAALLLFIGTLVFVLFIELTIARARPSVVLLGQLGYSPSALSRFMLGKFIPLLSGALILSAVSAMAAQLLVASAAKERGLMLQQVPGWPVWGALLLSAAILLLLVVRAVSSAISGEKL
ncbi:MAG: hypothetical protein H7257_08100 [Taibaiella sp.]|nr:hypothetical protein [Taibaiella sp.]